MTTQEYKKGREYEFLRWPKYKYLYLMAFDKMLEERKRRVELEGPREMWATAKDVFNWWMEYDVLPWQMEMQEWTEEYDEL